LQIHTLDFTSDSVFGYGSSANLAETMRIKGNGKVGIGTNSPAATLHVNGGSIVNGDVSIQGGITAGGVLTVGGGVTANSSITANGVINANSGINGAGKLNFNHPGFVGTAMTLQELSGQSYPLIVLDGNGNNFLILQNGSPNYLQMYGRGASVGQTLWDSISDQRLKQNVRPLDAGLKEVLQVQTVRYRYRDGMLPGLTSNEEHTGVLAQQVQEAFPDAVRQRNDGYLLLSPDPIFWASVNAIKELDQKLKEKDTEITGLKTRLDRLEALLNKQLGGGDK
jgi:hypothetical protein